MKAYTEDLDLPQTLAECHQSIRELQATLAASQGRVVELEGQKQAVGRRRCATAHRVFGRKTEGECCPRRSGCDPHGRPDRSPVTGISPGSGRD